MVLSGGGVDDGVSGRLFGVSDISDPGQVKDGMDRVYTSTCLTFTR